VINPGAEVCSLRKAQNRGQEPIIGWYSCALHKWFLFPVAESC
jgi:hypothetical protein